MAEPKPDLTEGGTKPWLKEERRETVDYDPGRLLTYAALIFVGALIIFVSFIIGVQIWKSGEANTESWAALTGLIGWATSQVSIIFSNRFGNTQQSAKKDEAIVNMSKTTAASANTAQDAKALADKAVDLALSSPAGTTAEEVKAKAAASVAGVDVAPVVTPAPELKDGTIPAAAVAPDQSTKEEPKV